jgi:hypothetical protein
MVALVMVAAPAHAEDLPRHARLGLKLADNGRLAVTAPGGADGVAVRDVVAALVTRLRAPIA